MKQRVIIFSTTYLPLIGGAEVAMKEITDRLPGWQFDLVCARIKPGLASVEKIGNVMVHRVGFGVSIDKYLLPVFGAFSALRLSNARSALVWSLMASYGGFAALIYCWFRPAAKMILNVQEGDPPERYAKRIGVWQFLHRAIFKRADAVLALSRFLADWVVRMGCRVTPRIIPNGVEVERFTKRLSAERRHELRTSYGFSDQDTVIVTASRLSLKNGVDDLVRACAFLPPSVKLLIAGDGEDREALVCLAAELGVADRIVFLGVRSQTEIPDILQTADVFVRASLSEGLGIAFLEAMAAGLPIIGTPVGGIPDFLVDGETGVFCQPRDPESIARAIQRLQSDARLRERLVTNGEQLIRQKYDWNDIVRTIEEVFHSL